MTMNINNENAYSHPHEQYENLDLVPTEVGMLSEYLSSETSESIFASLQEAVQAGNPAVANAFYAYDRKGYISTTPVGGEINRSYGSVDDVVLQITVRVPASEVKDLISEITNETVSAKEAILNEKREALDRQIAELQAQRASI